MKHVFAIANQKGGVGKTTTSINLAASLAAFGKRVLLMDLDPQGNTTSGLGIDKHHVDGGMYALLMGEKSLQDVIQETAYEGLFLVPATMDLAGSEVELAKEYGREYALHRACKLYDGEAFDYVLIDCPPALNVLTINALTFANRVLVTMQAEFYALEGLSQLMDSIGRIRSNLNPELMLDGILLTMVDLRNNLAIQVEKDVREYFDDQVYQQMIPRNVRLSEAPSYGMPVMYHDSQSKGAKAYTELAREIMKRQHQERRVNHAD
ncbi:MAG: ParA family protein [Mariprofundaceae bacterium]|nr:ParA family protein [Mariprofundaceae bacterium]